MPASKIGQNHPAPIALNQVFRHHSGKRWKGKEIRPVPPQPRRTAPQCVKDGLERIAGHVANALTTDGTRVKPKSVASLENADHAMGRLLGGLLQDAPKPKSVKNDILRFVSSTTYLRDRQGVSLSQLFDIRARVQLAYLTPDELRTLAKNLGQAITDSADQPHHKSLQVLNRLVHREQAVRTMLTAFKQALRVAPQGPEAVDYHLASVRTAAKHLLEQIGIPQDGSPKALSLQSAMVKEMLNHCLASGALSTADVRTMLDTMPSKVQCALRGAEHKPFFHPEGPLDAMLDQSMGARWASLQLGVREGTARVTQWSFPRQGEHRGAERADSPNPAKDLPRFADSIVQLTRQWTDLQAHHQASHLPIAPDITDSLTALCDKLRTDTLDAERLAPQIDRLSSTQLLAYRDSLISLGLQGPHLDQLTTRIQERKDNSLKDASNALRQAYLDLSKGDLPKALRWFEQAYEWAEEARDEQQELGERRWTGEEGRTAFYEHLTEHALTAADRDTLAGLYDTLNQKSTLALAGALQQVGGMQAYELDDPRGIVVQNVGKLLETMHTAIADLLNKTPQERQELSEDDNLRPTRQLSAQDCRQVSAFTGMTVFPSGTYGIAPSGMRDDFQKNLDAMLKPPALAHTSRRSLRDTGVTEAMWSNLTRATYATVGDRGDVNVVIGPNSRLRPDSPQLDFVVQNLRDDLGLSRSEFLWLSQVINPNLWSGVVAAMHSPDSPVRLPDGTPGYLMGTPSSAFTLRSDATGRVFVRCEHEIRNANAFVDPQSDTQTPIALDPAQSHAWFCVELEIGKDQQVKVSKPLMCNYALVPVAN